MNLLYSITSSSYHHGHLHMSYLHIICHPYFKLANINAKIYISEHISLRWQIGKMCIHKNHIICYIIQDQCEICMQLIVNDTILLYFVE